MWVNLEEGVSSENLEAVMNKHNITPEMRKNGLVGIFPAYSGGPSGNDIVYRISVWKGKK
jgi:hypothetical protein